MEAPTTKESAPADQTGALSPQPKEYPEYSAPDPDAHTDFADYPGTKKWVDDWHRRCIRAAVDERYFDMMPLGVRLQANAIRARLTGGDE